MASWHWVGFSAALVVGCGGSVANNGGTGSGPEGGSGGPDTGVMTLPAEGGIGPSADVSVPPSEGGAGHDGGGVTTMVDAGPGQTACGQMVCNAASQVCCVTAAGASCTALNACNGSTLVCSSSESCANNEVCCASIGGGRGPGGGGPTVQTECRTMCTAGEDELCIPGGAACPDGETCREVAMSGYYACERTFEAGPPPPPPPPADAGEAD